MSSLGPGRKVRSLYHTKLCLWVQLSCASELDLVIALPCALFLYSVAGTLGHFNF